MLGRRLFLRTAALGLTAGVAACSTARRLPFADGLPFGRPSLSGRVLTRFDYASIYAANMTEPHPIPAVDYTRLDPSFLRQRVVYRGGEAPGTVVVDPAARHLFLVEAPGRALRYGVGVGREGFGWSGLAKINMRRAWADWVPPPEMVARDPSIRPQLVATSRGLGVPGGPRSPLGARTLYLFAWNGGDTGYRIHGTIEPYTIGTQVSSGCIRMINQDVIDLYNRVSIGTPVIVLA